MRRTGRSAMAVTLGSAGLVALALLVVPMIGLAVRTPWSRIPEIAREQTVLQALRISLFASSLSLALSILTGIPLAWLLARVEFPGKAFVRTLATLPMVLPPVVGGVALLLAFGRRGIVGEPLAGLGGASLPFSTAGVVLAVTFVSMPFLVVTGEAGFRAMDRRLEDVAATLGARPWHVFRRITLPTLAAPLGAGMALTWARALGEFGATITFAGNLPGRTQTMPLAVFVQLESDPEVAYLLSFLLLAISVIVMLGVRRIPLLER